MQVGEIWADRRINICKSKKPGAPIGCPGLNSLGSALLQLTQQLVDRRREAGFCFCGILG